MSEALDHIADRTMRDWHRLEWALAYKRGLLAKCERQGEHELAASLARDIHDLERKITLHKVACALVRAAR